MPVPFTEDVVKHLLRRTEFVDRPARVSALLGLGSLEAAVDNVLAVGSAGTIALTAPTDWEKAEQYTHYWFDRMAFDSPRPIQEKIAFFWHGHFCSDLSKAEGAAVMKAQLDLWRGQGMTNLRTLAKAMSTQVAMLRYLDNNDNRKTSPNQNFGRELMELFMLGVGNYVEADVEACTAAWTGHTDNWETDAYVWEPSWHDTADKSYLGQTINTVKDANTQKLHGAETIDVMLGAGKVPSGASVVANRGRDTKAVAAEFISRKLWTFFAGTTAPTAVVNALRQVAIDEDFDITPWVRALLLRDEFYAADVLQGLVRSPVDLMVAMLVASGRRSADATPLWLMEGMGQRPMFPPNVSGWKHNGYFVNASAMAQRTFAGQMFFWNLMDDYWDEGGSVTLPGGVITRAEVTGEGPADPMDPHVLVDTFLSYMRLTPKTTSRNALYAFADQTNQWERINVLLLIFLMPEFHVA